MGTTVEAAKAIRLVAVFVIGVVLAMGAAMIYVVSSQMHKQEFSRGPAGPQRPNRKGFVNSQPHATTPMQPVQPLDVSESSTPVPTLPADKSAQATLQLPNTTAPPSPQPSIITQKSGSPPRTRQAAAASKSAQPIENQTGDGNADGGSNTEAPLTQPAADKPSELATVTGASPPTRAAAPPVSPPRSLTLWSGTPISVKLTDPLSTDQAKKGQHFHATLASALVQDGFILADAGSAVTGEIIEAKRAGAFHGPPELRLIVVQIHTTDNQDVHVATTSWDDRERSHNALTTTLRKTVSAVSDALAVPVMRGHNLVIPANTILQFQLAAPVSLTEHTR